MYLILQLRSSTFKIKCAQFSDLIPQTNGIKDVAYSIQYCILY